MPPVPQLLGLVGKYRAVRVGPEGEASHPPPDGFLDGDVLLGVGPARGEEGIVGERAAIDLLFPEPLLHRLLDGQSVGVPAGAKGAELASQVPVLHHDVLQHVVQGVPGVQLPVGVGRSVDEDESRRVGVLRQQRLVGALGVPAREQSGLQRGEVSLHREVGPREVERLFPAMFAGSVGHGGRG
jgi:hypothetical protein